MSQLERATMEAVGAAKAMTPEQTNVYAEKYYAKGLTAEQANAYAAPYDAKGGHPQRYPDGKCKTRPECMDTKCKGLCHLADSRDMQSGASAYLAPSEAGRINWLALIMLGALAGFWVSFGMAIKTAIQAGAVVL